MHNVGLTSQIHVTSSEQVTLHIRYALFCAISTKALTCLPKANRSRPRIRIGDVIDWTDYTGNRLHPSQKPVNLLLPLIDTFSAPGSLILDPFAGSGSTLVAAKMLGRSWLGIELDAKYHATASRRLEQPD
jgi:DNA modification methylase